jgi:endo-1,4-beta-xylanase
MRTGTRLGIVGLTLLGLLLPGAPLAPTALADDPTVAAYDFEDGTVQGWFARGSATVAATTDAANGGTHSLRTTGRTANWNGPSVELAPVLLTGASYAIAAHVRLAAGTEASSLQLTMQRLPVGGTTAFDFIAGGPVTDAGWVQLRGSYTVPTESSQLQLYIETANATASFDTDDVTVTMTAPPPDGLPDEAPIVSDYEDGTAQGWVPRIGSEVVAVTTEDAHSGTHSLLTTNRSAAFYGPSRNLLGRVTKGKRYDFSVWVKLAPGEAPSDMRLSIERRTGGTPSFQTVASAAGVTADAWVRLAGTFTLGVDVDFLTGYVETASTTASFYLDDFERIFVRPLPIEPDIPSLKDVFADDFTIGAATSPPDTLGVHAELLDKHFNSMTAGNAMKWDATEPTEGQFRFDDADVIANFAAAHDIGLRGHTLVWHSQVPDWVFRRPDGTDLTSSPADKALLLQRVENHIRGVAGRYAGQIYAWDVVNEVIDERQPDGLRRSRFFEISGLDYIRTAFRVAREVAPQAKLYLNDFNSEYPRKRTAMFNLVRQLLSEGVPVDGVGHQLHLNIERQRLVEIERSIETFATLGVEQQVTELDVSAYTNFVESLPAIPAETLAQQGYRYRDLFDLFRRHKQQINSVTVWGLADDRTWLKSFPFPRLDLPLLFDEQLQSKPAYWALVDPARLPQITRRLTVPFGRVDVDGNRGPEWDLLPGTDLHGRNGTSATFQARWDDRHLFVEAEVTDRTRNANDAVEIFVDQNNGKTPAYEPDDAGYRVGRNGAHGFLARTKPTPTGYRVEAAIPLRPNGSPDRQVGFDLRLRDAGSTVASFNDNANGQDADTSRWATLTLVKAIGQAAATRGTPVVDGVADRAWAHARTIATDVQVVGAGGARATAKLLWDAGHLYLLATVTDPALDESSQNTFEQDSIEIFVDPDNSKNTGYNDEDGQYRISFTNRQTITGNFDGFAIADNLRSATRIVPGGYVVEASIELDSIHAGAGTLLGFDLQVNDATSGARTAARTWHDPTGRSFVDTSRWGVARLEW